MAGTHIFISYRREDAAGHAGRLYDRLVQRFGEAQVFLDFDAIPGATDFTEEIRDALAQANVVLVVIGPRWLVSAGEGSCTAPPESRQSAGEMSECLPTPGAECATLCAYPGGRPCLKPANAGV